MEFRIKAFDPQHGVLVYAVDAQDETDARRLVFEQGRQLISIVTRVRLLPQSRAQRVPIVQFSEELTALLDAGARLPRPDTATPLRPTSSYRHRIAPVARSSATQPPGPASRRPRSSSLNVGTTARPSPSQGHPSEAPTSGVDHCCCPCVSNATTCSSSTCTTAP